MHKNFVEALMFMVQEFTKTIFFYLLWVKRSRNMNFCKLENLIQTPLVPIDVLLQPEILNTL